MKKSLLLILVSAVFSAFYLFYFQPSQAQSKYFPEDLSETNRTVNFSKQKEPVKQVPLMISNAKFAGAVFERHELFLTAGRQRATDDRNLREAVKEGAVFNLDKSAVQKIMREAPLFLSLPLTDASGNTIELELQKVNIFAPGFSVKTSSPTGEPTDENLGIHYRGIVKDDDRSVAAVSIFKDEIMGLYSTEAKGNTVLGRLSGNNPTGRHILFNDRDLKASPNFHCNTKDDEGVKLPESYYQEPSEELAARCVRIYLEANYDLFQNKGSVANVNSYLTGMFNQSATLYSNEGVAISISQIFVWTSPSPYTGTTSLQQLEQFKAFRTSFTGDLAHLITLQSSFGGIAYRPGLCSTFNYAFSGIDPTFQNVPTFSWTVMVFTHETGHNLGSHHTHACVWNGNNTAIDGCATTEGGCANPGIPSGGGTIMSYCHLQSVGINLSLGFGPQPHNVIVNSFNNSTCLTDCGSACTYSVSPTTSPTFASSGGTGSTGVTTGTSCAWTTTVNAPSLFELFSPFDESQNPFSDKVSSARKNNQEIVFQDTTPAGNNGDKTAGTVSAAPEAVFLNSTPITINDRASNTGAPGLGSLYPSSINVTGMTGAITKVRATVNGLSHTFPDDVDIILVGPGGQRAILMSDTGGDPDISGVNLTFDQAATASIPDAALITSGTYKPTNFAGNTTIEPSGVDNFPSPGPGQNSYGADLSVFNGTAPNGVWQLFVVDDENVDSGSISTGWALEITSGSSWVTITSGATGTGNGTVNYSVAANTGTSPRSGTIVVNGQATHTINQAAGGTVAGSVQFSSSTYSVNENGGAATITVTRTGGTAAFNVNYATSNGTATAGSDYTTASGTLSFASGETSKTFTVPIIDDAAFEGNETVNLALSSPTGGATIGSPGTAVMTIIDNESQPCTYSITPTSQNFTSSGGNGTVQVTTGAGCAWTATSNVPPGLAGNMSLLNLLPITDSLKSLSPTSVGSAIMTPAFSEGFENIATLPGAGWFTQNNSVPVGSVGWFQGNTAVFPAQGGTTTSYIGANFNNTTGANTISNWLLTPNITFNNGDVVKFWTRTATDSPFPDRLEVRLSTNGASTNVGSGSAAVGDFTTVLTTINPNLVVGGYPQVWTEVTLPISGLAGPTSGRIAMRYFVTNGGPTGDNSNFVGIDSFSYTPTTTGGGSWVTIAAPGSGTGSGSVSYSVAANTTGAPRSGTMTIGGQTFTVNQSAGGTTPRRQFDFDGDGRADISVFRPSTGSWYISNSGSGGSLTALQFGANGDLTAPADFDGDGRTDICVFRPSNGSWYRMNSATNTFFGIQFGANGDLPAPGDFDGDLKADITVYRPSAGSWYRLNSSNGQFVGNQFGVFEDKPIVADFDGDGRNDLCVFRPSNGSWYRINSSNGQFVGNQFGIPEDKPVAADYDGDGKAELAVYRPSVGYWYVISSINGAFSATKFGISEDKPAPADFDGDGRADFVVFRPSNGTWYLLRTTAGFTGAQFGTNGDVPTPNSFVR